MDENEKIAIIKESLLKQKAERLKGKQLMEQQGVPTESEKWGKKKTLGFAITVGFALIGVLAMEIAKYSVGYDSWLLDPIFATNDTDALTKIYLWTSPQKIVIRPNGESWTSATVTIYCGSDSWTYSCDKIAGERMIPLKDFADSRGNRFKPDEKRPQRAQMAGMVLKGFRESKARIKCDLSAENER